MITNDISESVSSGIDGKKTPQNGGLDEISDELRRSCELYEEKLRNGGKYVSHFEVEQRVAELYAKQHGLWIPMDNVFDLGIPGPCGNENGRQVRLSRRTCRPFSLLLGSGFFGWGCQKYSSALSVIMSRAIVFRRENSRYFSGSQICFFN